MADCDCLVCALRRLVARIFSAGRDQIQTWRSGASVDTPNPPFAPTP